MSGMQVPAVRTTNMASPPRRIFPRGPSTIGGGCVHQRNEPGGVHRHGPQSFLWAFSVSIEMQTREMTTCNVQTGEQLHCSNHLNSYGTFRCVSHSKTSMKEVQQGSYCRSTTHKWMQVPAKEILLTRITGELMGGVCRTAYLCEIKVRFVVVTKGERSRIHERNGVMNVWCLLQK